MLKMVTTIQCLRQLDNSRQLEGHYANPDRLPKTSLYGQHQFQNTITKTISQLLCSLWRRVELTVLSLARVVQTQAVQFEVGPLCGLICRLECVALLETHATLQCKAAEGKARVWLALAYIWTLAWISKNPSGWKHFLGCTVELHYTDKAN